MRHIRYYSNPNQQQEEELRRRRQLESVVQAESESVSFWVKYRMHIMIGVLIVAVGLCVYLYMRKSSKKVDSISSSKDDGDSGIDISDDVEEEGNCLDVESVDDIIIDSDNIGSSNNLRYIYF